MKTLTIPKIDISENDIERAEEQLMLQPLHAIDTLNWADNYPSKPEVGFRIAHNGGNLFLQYVVHENEILAEVTEDNGKVWTDSCVEFFVSFDNAHYYNAEFSCIGKALLGYREFGSKHALHAPTEVMSSIRRLPSLGINSIEKTQGDFRWTLTLIIPASAFWKSGIVSFDNLNAEGNFYKCGDNLTIPHFVSWAPIDTPQPSFHQPLFFGKLVFNKM